MTWYSQIFEEAARINWVVCLDIVSDLLAQDLAPILIVPGDLCILPRGTVKEPRPIPIMPSHSTSLLFTRLNERGQGQCTAPQRACIRILALGRRPQLSPSRCHWRRVVAFSDQSCGAPTEGDGEPLNQRSPSVCRQLEMADSWAVSGER